MYYFHSLFLLPLLLLLLLLKIEKVKVLTFPYNHHNAWKQASTHIPNDSISIVFQFNALFLGDGVITDQKKKDLFDAFALLNQFLEKSKYVAGENPTIADLAILATISGMIVSIWMDLIFTVFMFIICFCPFLS